MAETTVDYPRIPVLVRKESKMQSGAPLIAVAAGAVAALLLQLRRSSKHDKLSLKAIAQLKADRDAAQTHLRALEGRLTAHLEEYAAINNSNKEILDAYDTILKSSEELSSRLERSETFNRELQHKIKKERAERAKCEKHIAQLQRKIEEQETLLKQQGRDESGSLTARSDDSAKVLVESNKKVFKTPPLAHPEKWMNELQA